MKRISIVAVGKRMPAWVGEGYTEYQKRLQHELDITLVEVNQATRGKNTPAASAMQAESVNILRAVPPDSRIIVLDEGGKNVDTRGLSKKMEEWQLQGNDICFVIGGADGLDTAVKQRADECWSLSAFTLPHMLVRIILIEQLYRAWCILRNHPYHRD